MEGNCMKKRKAAASASGVETIAIKIDGKVQRTYQGLSGTFAGFAYNCLEKKILPGFFEEDLIKEAGLKDRKLILALAGNHSPTELLEILDIALLNLVAFPHAGSEAEFSIEAKSNKKGR
jgi:hypothetical protein